MEIAERNGHFCLRDEANNVFVRVGGSIGRENEAAILLQGHTDMVCEKNSDTVHDFENDPLKLELDGKWLRAKGTTLGADNGPPYPVRSSRRSRTLRRSPT